MLLNKSIQMVSNQGVKYPDKTDNLMLANTYIP